MEAPGRRQRMPPSDLRLYFQGLSDVHADILKELDAVVAEAADDEWQQLSENQRDRLLSAPFLLSEFSSREYNEDDFGGTVQQVREDARKRVQHLQWQDEIAQKKSEKERQRRRKARGKPLLVAQSPKQRSQVQIVDTAADAVESRYRSATIAGSKPASSQGSAASIEFDLARIQRRHPSRGISAFLDGGASSEHMPTSSKALAALALTPPTRRHHQRSNESLGHGLSRPRSQSDLRTSSGTSTDPLQSELDVDLIHAQPPTRDSGTGSRVSRVEPVSPVSVTRKGNRLITRFSANDMVDASSQPTTPSAFRASPTDDFAALESLVLGTTSNRGRDEYIQVDAELDDVTSPLNASGHVDAAWQAGGDDLDVAASDDFDQLVAAFGLTSGSKSPSKPPSLKSPAVTKVSEPISNPRAVPSTQRNMPSGTATIRRQVPLPLVKERSIEVPESSAGPLPVRLGDTRKAQNTSTISTAPDNDGGSSSRIRKLPARKRMPVRKGGVAVVAVVKPEPVSPRASDSPRLKVLSPKSPTVAFSNI